MSSYPAVVLADSPVSYYRLSEQGYQTADTSGNNQDGSYNSAGVTYGVGSLVSDSKNAVTLNGSSGKAVLPVFGFPSAHGAWSIECWIKAASWPGSGASPIIAGFGNWGSTRQMATLNVDPSGKPGVAVWADDYASGSALSTGAAHHLVATYDGNTTLKLYVDGSLDGSHTTGAQLGVVLTGARIGCALNDSGNFLAATLQKVAFYNVALTLTQVGNHHSATGAGYDAAILADSPIAYYPLGDASIPSSNVIDSSGNSHTATLGSYIGRTASLLVGDSDNAMRMNGAASITVPTTGLQTGNGAWSIECWFKIPSASALANGGALLAGWGTWASNNENAYISVNTSGQAQCGVYSHDYHGSGAISYNTRHHIVGTYDGTTITLYLDGTSIATGTPGAVNIVAAGAHIGDTPAGTGVAFTTFLLNGVIDEVAMYSTCLSSARVTVHYNTGLNAGINISVTITEQEEVSLTVTTPTVAKPIPLYALYVRDNASGDLVDYVDDPIEVGGSFVFNGVSELVCAINAESIHLANVLQDDDGNYHSGLIFTRDNQDGTGPIELFSGPISHAAVDLDTSQVDNPWSVLITADSDDYILRDNPATPPLSTQVYATEVLSDSPTRYYRLGEPSGTTATDAAGNADGTYHGSIALGLPGALADDAGTGASFDGSSAYVEVPISGLPTGNSAWSLAAWVYLNDKPATNDAVIMNFGTWASNGEAAHLIIHHDSSDAYVSAFGTVYDTQKTSLSLKEWHYLVGTWDGTNISFYVDGLPKDQKKPTSVMNITAHAAAIGRSESGVDYLQVGTIVQEAVFYSAALPAPRVAALYALGRSHFNLSAYDTRTDVVSTLMIDYTEANIGASAPVARQISNLVFDPDPVVGGTVQESVRFNTLLETNQNLSLRATTELGFRVYQPLNSKQLHYTIYQPRNLESVALFSRAIGNLTRLHYGADQPTANVAIVGGNGSGINRLIIMRQNDDSITRWGRRVTKFYNHSNLANVTDAQQQGDTDLDTDADVSACGFEAVDIEGCVFLRDYGLGDLVTVVVDLPGMDTFVVQDIIRQVTFSLKQGQRDIIQPVIGNPQATHPLSFNRALHKQIFKQNKQVTALTVNQ